VQGCGDGVDVAYFEKASNVHNLRVCIRQKDYFDTAWLTMRCLCDPLAVPGSSPFSSPGDLPAAGERMLGSQSLTLTLALESRILAASPPTDGSRFQACSRWLREDVA